MSEELSKVVAMTKLASADLASLAKLEEQRADVALHYSETTKADVAARAELTQVTSRIKEARAELELLREKAPEARGASPSSSSSDP